MPTKPPPEDTTTTKQNSSSKLRDLIRNGVMTIVWAVIYGAAVLLGMIWLGITDGWEWAILLVLSVSAIMAYSAYTSLRKPLHLLLLTLQIQRLTHPSDMPRCIKLCRMALTLVERDTQPKQWANWQNTLGFSLMQNPLGDRADNLEQAIDHLKLSLEVYTRQAFPFEWAQSSNNLATAYEQRIKGERADNIERAICFYEQAIEVVTRQAFPFEWATSMNNLALAYELRIKGERADNIERAIYLYEQALEVRTRQSTPYEWANTMMNLAGAYENRIEGAWPDNLEQAIKCLEQSLEVYTRQTFPEEWAQSCNNLANALMNHINSEYADNIEQAINYLKQALEVRTRQAFPEYWATSINNLGLAYNFRIRGERAKNLELAISYFKQSQEVWTFQAFPEHWATSINNLALAYNDRIKGELADNIEQAIQYYKQALEVRTRQAFPYKWAQCCSSLATAYSDRIRGKPSDNIKLAIEYLEQSLEVYTRQGTPKEWATSCNNLASAYQKRIGEERAESLERAIEYYEQAQQVWTRQAAPYDWALSCNNLAAVYDNRIMGERGDNIERAISLYEQSQEIWTRQAFPFEWAMSIGRLATTVDNRIRGERVDNLERAISLYQQSLEINTPPSYPQRCRNLAYKLGRLLYDEQRFDEALKAFTTAHEAVEALRGEVVRDGARRKLAEENANLYARLVFCCLQPSLSPSQGEGSQRDIEAAFEYAVAGKGRAFVDMLGSARFDLFAAEAHDPALAADLQEYRELRQQIDNLRSRLAGQSAQVKEKEGLREQEWEVLRNLQQQELERWEDLTYKYPSLTATQSAPSLSVKAAQALASDLGATLVEFVRHMGGWSAFVVRSEAVRHVPLPDVNDEFLQEVKQCWTKIVERLICDGYYNAEDFYTLEEWYEALIMPLKPYLPRSGKVVLAPAGALHLIPLSIARNPDTLAYLCDEYTLSFAPSLAALRVTHLEAKKRGTTKDESGTLLAVAYPGQLGQANYLSHAVAESYAIERHFSNVTRLYDEVATPQAVVEKAKGQAVVHFSCHGTFDSSLPEQSGLALSGGYLTVQRIITELNLSDARLATLSACVTHQADLRAGEEHVGLVQSVLTAGAQSVVASLWSVPEQATRVLFEQFYGAVANGKAPAQALTEAMQHVRQQPGWEHPFYWAAFQVSGLGYDIGK